MRQRSLSYVLSRNFAAWIAGKEDRDKMDIFDPPKWVRKDKNLLRSYGRGFDGQEYKD